jgi:recombinational DNA repair protein RecR
MEAGYEFKPDETQVDSILLRLTEEAINTLFTAVDRLIEVGASEEQINKLIHSYVTFKVEIASGLSNHSVFEPTTSQRLI